MKIAVFVRQRSKQALLAGCVVASGCGTSSTYTALAPHPYPRSASDAPIRPDEVTLMTTAPLQEYVEVGIIEAKEASVYASEDTKAIFLQLQIEGARRRCDAVLIGGSNHKTQYDLFSDTSDSVDGWWGTCLVFVRDSTGPGESVSVAR